VDALAAARGNDHEVIDEVADLCYHHLVLLKTRGLTLECALKELEARRVADAASSVET
jgi:phosphoribosyl-ATP pyrophosphohydrolase